MFTLFFSFLLGVAAVIQGGLNKQMTSDWGLFGALLINSTVLLIIVILMAFATAIYPQYFPAYLAPKFNWSTWKWWYFIPAICGTMLITGIPLAITKWGALVVFLTIVVGQMVSSIVWDMSMEGIALDPKRLLGVALAIVGLAISSWR